MTTETNGPPVARTRHPADSLGRLLEHATLPRVLVRTAECALLSGVEFRRPILDVGCGDGSFAAACFTDPVDVGIDPWRRGLGAARSAGAYRHLVRADGGRLPFADAAFATVLSNSTLEHIPDPDAVLREMHRVCRSGATCVITVPSEHFADYLLGSTVLRALRLRTAAGLYGRLMNRVSRHVHVDPADTWRRRIEDAGFRVQEWRYYFPHRGTMALDVSHYLSAPSILTRAVLGRWVLWPGKRRYIPLGRALARFCSPGENSSGAYLFFHCTKP